ncbi:hypothetical protein EDD16DRAFT_1516878 [Pisolithus croceorrhizus]|nr:hypothetical protein EDD16DRAFT_1516878 [Pisolithus croceorrhizus]
MYPLHEPPGIRTEALRLSAGQSTYTPASVEQHKGATQLNFIRVVASYDDPHHPKQVMVPLITHYLIFNPKASHIQEWQKGSKAGGHTTHQPNFVVHMLVLTTGRGSYPTHRSKSKRAASFCNWSALHAACFLRLFMLTLSHPSIGPGVAQC